MLSYMDSSLWPYLPDAFLDVTLHDMMQLLDAHFVVDQTPDIHELLMTETRQMTYTDPKKMVDYLLRQTITRERYPKIGDEATTIDFIVLGLIAHPNLST